MGAKLLVEHVEGSITSIKLQISKVIQLKKGIHVMRDEIHIEDEEHNFKRWLEEEGAYIRKHIPGNIIPDIVALHRAWFTEYHKIYDLYFPKEGGSWFGNKNKPKHLNPQEKERLEIYYEDLMEVHERLLHKFDILHLRVASSHEVDDADIIHNEKLVI